MKQTYQPKKLKRLRKHGFLEKNSTAAGRAVIRKRQLKGRKKVIVASA